MSHPKHTDCYNRKYKEMFVELFIRRTFDHQRFYDSLKHDFFALRPYTLYDEFMDNQTDLLSESTEEFLEYLYFNAKKLQEDFSDERATVVNILNPNDESTVLEGFILHDNGIIYYTETTEL